MIAGIVAASLCTLAHGQTVRHAATVTLDGDWFLQAGTVLNESDAGVSITAMTYSMGAPEDGVGVWEDFLAGGQHRNRLPGSATHYSSQVWSGLQVGSQASWSFDGLDLDRIVRVATGEVDSQNLDFAGATLRHAYVELHFSDGYEARARLAEQGWNVTQVLRFGDAVSPVPEPASAVMLAAGLGLVWSRRRIGG